MSWLTPPVQEVLALTVVGALSAGFATRVLLALYGEAMALWLARRGRVRWAMRLKRVARAAR